MTSVLERKENLYATCLDFVSNEVYGMKSIASTDEMQIVNRAIELLESAIAGQDVSHDQWTQLKEMTVLHVGSPVADGISRVASAMRNPTQAGISGIRDFIEKLIVAHYESIDREIEKLEQRKNDMKSLIRSAVALKLGSLMITN